MKITYRCTDIRWDTDDEVDLPTEQTVTVETYGLAEEEIEEKIGDALSDSTGFCHNGFDYEAVGVDAN